MCFFVAIKTACSLDDVSVAVPSSTPGRSVTNRNGMVKVSYRAVCDLVEYALQTAPASVGSFDNIEITHDVATVELSRSSRYTLQWGLCVHVLCAEPTRIGGRRSFNAV